MGIGATMLLHCDLAFAGAGARFRLPFTSLGLSPEGASTYLLPRLAGDKRAAELLLLGEMFGADEAAEAGLINRVVESGNRTDRSPGPGGRPCRTSGRIDRGNEGTAARSTGSAVRDALANEYAVFNERLVSDDAKAAFARFTAKT